MILLKLMQFAVFLIYATVKIHRTYIRLSM